MTKSKISVLQARIGISLFAMAILVALINSFLSLNPEDTITDFHIKIMTNKVILIGVLGELIWLWLNPNYLLQSGNIFNSIEPKLETRYRLLHYSSHLLILAGLIDVFIN